MSSSKGATLQSITIKNGFVEDGVYDTDEYGAEDGDYMIQQIPKRQVSEPVTAMKARQYHSAILFSTGERSESGSEPEKESEPAVGTDAPTMDDLPTIDSADSSRVPVFGSHASVSAYSSSPLPTPAKFSPLPSSPEDAIAGTGAALVMNDAAFSSPTSLLAANALAAANGISVPSLMWTNVYTVMLRNIPNKVSQQVLLQELDDCGFTHGFDFLYLPIDPETNANRGYAFINFVTPNLAMMFRMSFEGRKFANFKSDKVMSTVPAALQGFEANHAHYSRARVNQRELGARPLFLRDPLVGKDMRQRRNKPDSLIDIAAKAQREKQGQHDHQWASQQQLPQQPLPSPSASGRMSRQAVEPPKAKPSFCHNCGSGIRPDFKFCQMCGMAF
jgi:hypothetical protein